MATNGACCRVCGQNLDCVGDAHQCIPDRGSRFVINDPGYDPNSTLSWWRESIPSRINSTGPVVVIMARLHHDDISGTTLSSDLNYDYLKIP